MKESFQKLKDFIKVGESVGFEWVKGIKLSRIVIDVNRTNKYKGK